MYKMLDLFFGLVYTWIKPERLLAYLAAALYRDHTDENKVIKKFLKSGMQEILSRKFQDEV